jgi:hypothetical protein
LGLAQLKTLKLKIGYRDIKRMQIPQRSNGAAVLKTSVPVRTINEEQEGEGYDVE